MLLYGTDPIGPESTESEFENDRRGQGHLRLALVPPKRQPDETSEQPDETNELHNNVRDYNTR